MFLTRTRKDPFFNLTLNVHSVFKEYQNLPSEYFYHMSSLFHFHYHYQARTLAISYRSGFLTGFSVLVLSLQSPPRKNQNCLLKSGSDISLIKISTNSFYSNDPPSPYPIFYALLNSTCPSLLSSDITQKAFLLPFHTYPSLS